MVGHPGEFIRGLLILLFFAGAGGWLIVSTIRKSEEPARMIVKWVFTFLVLGVLFLVVGPIVGKGGYGGAFIGIPATAVCGLALAITWRRSIASLVADPVASLYDGGREPPVPHPTYSTAQAKYKKGLCEEAIAEVRVQLERFPTDFEGHLLLAEIQAEGLHDLVAAEETIHQWCNQPGHAPKNITFALFSLADWYLKVGHDSEGARRALTRIIDQLPDTEHALNAAQRIAHLGDARMMLDPSERKKYTVTEGVRHIGLLSDYRGTRPQEKEPGELAAEYVKHLTKHPLDTEARELLARLYSDHFQRLDLATDQLEQMIECPNQPARLVVRWLNLLADLQVHHGADLETIARTLQRIIDRDPNMAAAEVARRRLNLLKLELKAREQNESVKMGSYEQNIGLKQGRNKPKGE